MIGRVSMSNLVRRFLLTAALGMGLFLAGCSSLQTPTENSATATITPIPTETPTIVWFPPTPTLAAPPTNTPMPDTDLKPGIGALLFTDTFETTEFWQQVSTANGNIAVGGGKLTLAVLAPKATLQTFRTNTTLDNFYAEVTMTPNLCQGDDTLGILFRTNGADSYYRYLLDCKGRVSAQVVIGGAPTDMQAWTPSGELLSGLPSPVKLGIWASRDVLRFFINDQYQFEVTRGTYIKGGIGFYARAASDSALSVSFSNLSVYQVAVGDVKTLTPPPSPTKFVPPPIR